MKHFKIFVDLTRLNKPIGLCFCFGHVRAWLCFFQNDLNFFILSSAFLLGSVLMRSAGCIFYIVDKDIDSKVEE